MRVPTKTELGGRLAEYPLLRLLLFNPGFRLTVAGVALLLFSLALCLPRICRVTPKGFSPVLKISVLDWLQARSLRRTARRADAAGRTKDARFAWQAAIASDPADPELLRGGLRAVLPGQPLPPDLSAVLCQASWLLRLTATNEADLELVSRVAERLQFYDWELTLFNPRVEQLDARLEAAYLKALFNAGRRDAFIHHWHHRRNDAISDPELDLYLAAYAIGWGPLQGIAEADQRLEIALDNPALRVLAARLQLTVAARLGDLPHCERALHLLRVSGSDTIADHAGYWQVMAALGRKSAACDLAAHCLRTPETALETARLAEIFDQLGLRSEALELLDRYATRFVPADAIWITQANLLIKDRRWESAHAVAIRIRLQEDVRSALSGFSYYVEGRADLGEDRRASAEKAFRLCVGAQFPNAALGLFVARELLRLGEAAVARDLLLRLEPPLACEADYWRLLRAVAFELKQSDVVLSAAAAGYRLQPTSPEVANDYAAALVLCRRDPEKALSLTLQLLAQHPDSASAKINHSLALLLNNRAAEAEALLRTVEARRLIGPAATMHALAGFETCLALERYDEARRDSERIDSRHLFPGQIERLEQERRRLPPPPAGRT